MIEKRAVNKEYNLLTKHNIALHIYNVKYYFMHE